MTCGFCRDCKHWGEVSQGVGRACEKQFVEGDESKMWPEMYDIIFTASDFGCVQFEAK